MSNFDYSDPVITRRRKGDISDPFVSFNEPLTIDTTTYTVVLTEIPDRLARVRVSGQSVTWVEIQEGLPTIDQYIVDYVGRVVTFHPSRGGLQLSFQYMGTGLHFIPASSVYTQQSGGNVTQTLDTLTKGAAQFVFLGDYNSATIYKQYNIVNYQGASYMFANATPSSGHLPSDPIYWARISGSLYRGTYNTAISYNSGDVVSDAANTKLLQSLVSNNTNNALTDATKWQLLIDVSGAVSSANTAASSANTAASSASSAASSASSAASAANTAKANADTATTNANNAAASANSAATSANNLVVTFVSKGDYNSATAYVPNNTVRYQGSTWRCLQNATGITPIEGTNWTLMAQKGLDGTGTGTVTSVASANGDITVTNPTTAPVLTVNTGVGANQVAKRDANGNLQNIGYAITNVSVNTTLTLAQSGIINVTTGASNITITLPDATTAQVVFTIKKADSGVGQVVINTTASQTIDGTTSKTLINQYATITVVSGLGNWLVEVHNDTDKIGVLSGLTTTSKSSLMSAINEVQQMPTSNMARQAGINFNFDIWQRGTSFTNPASGSYVADRWRRAHNGSGMVHSVSQQSFLVGQTVVPNNPNFYMRTAVTTAATGQTFNVVAYPIEDVRNFAGQSVTVSLWAKADSAITVTPQIQQVFGAGGSITADNGFPSAFSLTTNWQKFTGTVTLASISGKTIGSGSYLLLNIYLPINAISTVDIAQVQLNAGNVALPFQPRSFGEELALCKRYYERSSAQFANDGMALGYAEANDFINFSIRYQVSKRVTPTIKVYDKSGSVDAINVATAGRAQVTGASTIGFHAIDGGFAILNAIATPGSSYLCHWVSDSEL